MLYTLCLLSLLPPTPNGTNSNYAPGTCSETQYRAHNHCPGQNSPMGTNSALGSGYEPSSGSRNRCPGHISQGIFQKKSIIHGWAPILPWAAVLIPRAGKGL